MWLTRAWASIAQYDPANPTYSHFTQVVWKGTTEVGCAIAYCDSIMAGWGVSRHSSPIYFQCIVLIAARPASRLPASWCASTTSPATCSESSRTSTECSLSWHIVSRRRPLVYQRERAGLKSGQTSRAVWRVYTCEHLIASSAGCVLTWWDSRRPNRIVQGSAGSRPAPSLSRSRCMQSSRPFRCRGASGMHTRYPYRLDSLPVAAVLPMQSIFINRLDVFKQDSNESSLCHVVCGINVSDCRQM